jgi:hypothetical protein
VLELFADLVLADYVVATGLRIDSRTAWHTCQYTCTAAAAAAAAAAAMSVFVGLELFTDLILAEYLVGVGSAPPALYGRLPLEALPRFFV